MDITASYLVNLDKATFYQKEILWIDHRSEEEEIVECVSSRISDSLSAYWEDDELWLNIESQKIKLPLTFSKHDRFITISSLAELLKQKYTFWLVKDHIEDDTIGLLVLANDISKTLKSKYFDWTNENLVELDPGYDYFNKIEVPYVGNLENNLNLEKTESVEVKPGSGISSFIDYIHSKYHLFGYWKSMTKLKMLSGSATIWDRILLNLVMYWWLFPGLGLIYILRQ